MSGRKDGSNKLHTNLVTYLKSSKNLHERKQKLIEIIQYVYQSYQARGINVTAKEIYAVLGEVGVVDMDPLHVSKVLKHISLSAVGGNQLEGLNRIESALKDTSNAQLISTESSKLWNDVIQYSTQPTDRKSSDATHSTNELKRQIAILSLIQRMTEAILNINFDEFTRKLLYFNRKSKESNLNVELFEKQQLQRRIKLMKEDFNIIQKQNRTLQNALRNLENRMSMSSSISSPFASGEQDASTLASGAEKPKLKLRIKSDMNEFQIAILKQDLERFTIYYERLKTKLEQQQNELLRYQQRTTQQDTSFSKNKPSKTISSKTKSKDQQNTQTTMDKHQQKVIHEDKSQTSEIIDETNWRTSLDFTAMNEANRFKFLLVLEKLMWPQNNMIRNMFERNVGIVRFTDLIPNTYFWRLWFQKRQLHEYAEKLRQQFRANYIHSPATILDERLLFDRLKSVEPDFSQLQQWPTEDTMFRDYNYVRQMESHRDQMLLQSMFMLREEDIPIYNHNIYDPREAISFLGESVHWQDPFYLYIYQANFQQTERKSISFATNNNIQYWNDLYDAFIDLSAFLREEYIVQETTQIDDRNANHNNTWKRDEMFRRYAYSLCRVSNDSERCLWIISQLLRGESNQIFERIQFRVLDQTRKPNQLQPGRNIKQLTSTIVDKVHKSILQKLNLITKEPVRFMNELQFAIQTVNENQISNNLHSMPIAKWYPTVSLEKGFPSNERLYIFVNMLCSRFQGDMASIEYNIQMFIACLRHRLHLEEEDFWGAISSEMASKTPYSINNWNLYQTYECDYFTISPLHFSKRKRITYKEKVKMIIIEVLDIIRVMDLRQETEASLQKELEVTQKKLKQQAKLHSKQYRIVDHTYMPTITRIITEESSNELRQRILCYYYYKKGIHIRRIERSHIQEFTNAEIRFIFQEKYPHLLDFRPDSHSLMVEYHRSRPFFALATLARLERERKERLKAYEALDPEDLDSKLDFAMATPHQANKLKSHHILRQFISQHLHTREDITQPLHT